MDYILSDPHGCYSLVCRLLDAVRISPQDRLFVLGDLIDKGPESVRLMQLLFSMPNAVCIAGNHEYDFLKYYRGLMRTEQDYDFVLEKLRGYFSDGRLLDWDTVDRLDLLPFYVEQPQWVGVHAGLPVRAGVCLPPAEATCEQLVYDRRFKDADVLPVGGKCVAFGHTPVRYLTGRDEIVCYPRAGVRQLVRSISDCCKIHLDMMTDRSGVLGCVCVEPFRLIYVTDD